MFADKRLFTLALAAAALIAFILAAGPPSAFCQAENEDDEEESSALSAQRRDAAMGIDGWFEFTFDSDTYRSEWGYADTESLQGGNRMRITLLSSPVGSDFYPVLKITVLVRIASVEELLGRDLRVQRVRMRLNPETERSFTGRGSGTVRLEKLADGWLEGKYKLEMQGSPIEGEFKARFYRTAVKSP